MILPPEDTRKLVQQNRIMFLVKPAAVYRQCSIMQALCYRTRLHDATSCYIMQVFCRKLTVKNLPIGSRDGKKMYRPGKKFVETVMFAGSHTTIVV